MRKVSLRPSVITTFFFCSLVVNAASIGAAHAEEERLCLPVHANINSEFTGTGCESPVGLCTEGMITNGGFLNGKTFFTALSVAAAAGMPGVEPETTLSYSGFLEVQTGHGDLQIQDVGISETATGTFSEIERIVGGTGRFAEASGTLFIYGDATADGTGFTGTIRGEMCLGR